MSQVRNRVNLGVLTALPSQADEGDSCIYDGALWIYVNDTWTKIGKGSMGFNLFDLKLVDRVLTGDDAVNWGLLNTATGTSSITSPANIDFYKKILNIFNSLVANTSEEQGDIRYDESGNGYYKISDTTAKNYVNQYYTDNGVAWFYGIDTVYQRIYLPRIKNVYLGMGNLNDSPVVRDGNKSLGLDAGLGRLFGLRSFSKADGTLINGLYISQPSYGLIIGSTPPPASGLIQIPDTAIGLSSDELTSGAICKTSSIASKLNMKPGYLYMCIGNTAVNDSKTDWAQLNESVSTIINEIDELKNKSITVEKGENVDITSYFTSGDRTFTPPSFGRILIDVVASGSDSAIFLAVVAENRSLFGQYLERSGMSYAFNATVVAGETVRYDVNGSPTLSKAVFVPFNIKTMDPTNQEEPQGEN